MKVYGPYTRSDGRKHVITVDDKGNRRTVSYPKYLVEMSTGKKLSHEDTIDHIDGDLGNNSLDNLKVVSRRENASLSRQSIPRVRLVCPRCNMLHVKRSTVYFVQQFVLCINANLCERCKSW